MTPTTPTGDRSTVADIFAIRRPGERCDVRMTDSAWRAAHAICPAANEASSFASLTGLPVSRDTSSVSESILARRSELHFSKTLRRPRKPKSRHSSEAARALSTAALTASSL